MKVFYEKSKRPTTFMKICRKSSIRDAKEDSRRDESWKIENTVIAAEAAEWNLIVREDEI